MSILYLDTETNGIGNFRPPTQRIVQIAWIYNIPKSYLINDVKEIAEKVPHTITVNQCKSEGDDFEAIFSEFFKDFSNASLIVAHNIDFDIGSIKNELKIRNSKLYNNFKKLLETKHFKCTMKDSVNICKLKFSPDSINYKYPKLSELYFHYYKTEPELTPHDALNDCYILKMCYEKMTSTLG